MLDLYLNIRFFYVTQDSLEGVGGTTKNLTKSVAMLAEKIDRLSTVVNNSLGSGLLESLAQVWHTHTHAFTHKKPPPAFVSSMAVLTHTKVCA
jgi:hypothetical protein